MAELPERLLILRFSALGDVAMMVPAIYSVARAWPAIEIYVATRPFFARMFINAPANVHVISFDLKEERYKGLRGTLRIARELGRLQPDYVADMHGIARSVIITALLRMEGAQTVTIDKSRLTRNRVFRGGPAQKQYVRRYFDTLAKLGFDAAQTFTSVYDVSAVPAPAVEIQHPAVGIAPFARYLTKTYPPEMMLKVARGLAERGVHVYLLGGRGKEAETLSTWEQPGIESLAGRFPLEDEIATMAHMDVVVSMDSANQHLAGLAGTKVVSVWGSTTPACGFLGFGQTVDNTIVAGVDCQPCTIAGGKSCLRGDMACMRTIPPQVIIDKVLSMLEKEK